MESLIAAAERAANLLRARKETIALAESSTGGLICAALLALPGASAYFTGGAVVYTRRARKALLDIPDDAVKGMRSATPPYALLLARTTMQRHAATWGLAETGAAGPTGNRYGDAAGHCCLALTGPVERVMTLATGIADRPANMRRFALGAFELLIESLNA